MGHMVLFSFSGLIFQPQDLVLLPSGGQLESSARNISCRVPFEKQLNQRFPKCALQRPGIARGTHCGMTTVRSQEDHGMSPPAAGEDSVWPAVLQCAKTTCWEQPTCPDPLSVTSGLTLGLQTWK